MVEAATGGAAVAVEVIVADGGSIDATCELAAAAGARVVKGLRGRGLQMDTGAAVAVGDVLLFLHADTRLPEGWYDAVIECLGDDAVAGGAFTLAIDSPGTWFRMVERVAALRSKLLGLVYGDQAIFVRRNAFIRVRGFRGLPLMEDVDMVRRLSAIGKFVCLPQRVLTSARRWQRVGVYKNTLRNWLFIVLYYIGVSPRRLYNRYYRRRGAK